MKLILIIIPFYICSLAELSVPEITKQVSASQLLSDTIKWSPDYKLNVDDFKELKMDNKGVKYDSLNYKLRAYSTVTIGYTFKSEKGKTVFDAFALFVRSRSWIKENNESVVKHEQGHFDITEIYARKLEQAVREMKNIEDPSFWASFQKTYQEINGLHLKEQDKYDEMAMTSLGQDYYYKKILGELKAAE
jgi:hypothetical protein